MLPRNRPNPAARACLPCREKHLKCDGQTPVCQRCVSANLDSSCIFVQSRRGRRAAPAAAKADAPAVTPQTSLLPTTNSQLDLPLNGFQLLPSNTQQQQELVGLRRQESQSQSQGHQTESVSPTPQASAASRNDDYFITLYYRFIHPAHPFLFPQKLYQQNSSIFPDHLKRSICFIASHHASSCTEELRDASNAVFGSHIADDGFKVQSFILVALASFARFERERGAQALSAAVELAQRINLNSDNFACDHEPLLRESWRRTWWELYSISGLISLIGGTDISLAIPTGLSLPCDCEDYEACQIPAKTGTSEDLQQRFLAETSTPWSSFAYRIEAMRILTMVLKANDALSSSQKQAGEAAISSFLFALPPEKKEALNADGDVDEVMSCAIMIINLAGICLHLPQSPLAHAGSFKTVCGNDMTGTFSESPVLHQTTAIRCAKSLTRLLTTHATSLSTLSPCFSCAISYSSVALLADYSIRTAPRPRFLAENLQLSLSALRSLGQIWPIANVVRGQIATFAREVMCVTSNNDRNGNKRVSDEAMPDLELLPSFDEQWLQELLSTDTTDLPQGDMGSTFP